MAGLADITRIKSEDLRYAIRYSYFKDMHFLFYLVIVFFAGSKPMVVPCPRSFAFFILDRNRRKRIRTLEPAISKSLPPFMEQEADSSLDY